MLKPFFFKVCDIASYFILKALFPVVLGTLNIFNTFSFQLQVPPLVSHIQLLPNSIKPFSKIGTTD